MSNWRDGSPIRRGDRVLNFLQWPGSIRGTVVEVHADWLTTEFDDGAICRTPITWPQR